MIDKAKYKTQIQMNKEKPKLLVNVLKAFLVGGLISVFGQILIYLNMELLNFDKQQAGALMVSTLIFIGSLLTAHGVYDKIGQFSGAGSLIPVTGFANTMTSAALEYKNEGFVAGIAANMFKLAGSVIVTGVVAAYVLNIVRYVIEVFI